MSCRIKQYLLILHVFLCVTVCTYSADKALTWADCIRESLTNNPDLISAVESIRQAEAKVKVAGSGLMPSVSTSLSGDRSGGDLVNEDNSFSVGVSAKQLIYDGGKTLRNKDSSREQLNATRFKYDVASANVRRSVRLAFIDLLKAQRQVTITENILVRRKQSTKLIRLRYEGGREHKGSLMTAEAKEAQADFDHVQAQRNVMMAQSSLAEVLGRRPGDGTSDLSVQGELESSKIDVEKPDFWGMAESTPLVKELCAQSNIANLGVKSAKAEFYPGVYANAGASRSSSDWPPDQDQWSVGLSMSFPLFEGGSRVAELDRAKSVFRQADSELRSGLLSAASILQIRWISMRNASDRVKVREKFLDAARERARIAEGQYSASLIVFDSWIIIEDDFVQADQSLLESQAAALIAEAEWIQAKGGTLENEVK
ncbi:MAG: TolC family protein [Kiritimatiellae bacterium]|nr:TolC family protein [Kiritimatiellia bacterium]